MELTIRIQGLEGLEAALKQLAYAVAGNAGTKSGDQTLQTPHQVQAQYAPPQVQAQHTPPQVQAQYTPPQVQAQHTPPQVQPQYAPAGQQAAAVPTAQVQQAYTQDQIAVAMTGLMDAGRRDSIMQILGDFGARSLMEVPKDLYPALAARLRQEGAAI